MSTIKRSGAGSGRARAARRLAVWLAAALAVMLVAAAGYLGATRAAMLQLHEAQGHRLDVVSAALDGELARFEYLPSLLETSPSVLQLLDRPGDSALRAEVNQYLRRINDTAGASTLYVIDDQGLTLAASDAAEPGSPLDTNLSFRPYVRDALAQGRGRFFGVGTTSKKAGYYLSYALRQGQRLRGIGVAKVSLAQTESAWKRLPGEIVVADAQGVVILSTRSDWKYRPLAALSASALADIAQSQPYGESALQALRWQSSETMVSGLQWLGVQRERFVGSQRAYGPMHWQVFVLDDAAQLQETGMDGALMTGLAAALLLLATMLVLQRRRTTRLKLASQAALQAAHDSLESKVAERTEELRAAQNELVHAGKMAVLGQMSAGMVHERTQPLAALRTLSDNAGVLLEHQRLDDVRSNLRRIALLVDRMARLTLQLKSFSYKSAIVFAPVGIEQAVASAQLMVMQKLRESGVTLEVAITPPGLTAQAEAVRLEQVLVNLFGNAIDAMAQSAVRCLRVEACADQGQCRITVTDTGPGISDAIFARLFEPFTTTKPMGHGLGLGLMISSHSMQELGGTLQACNLPQGGACFTLVLPLAELPKEIKS